MKWRTFTLTDFFDDHDPEGHYGYLDLDPVEFPDDQSTLCLWYGGGFMPQVSPLGDVLCEKDTWTHYIPLWELGDPTNG